MGDSAKVAHPTRYSNSTLKSLNDFFQHLYFSYMETMMHLLKGSLGTGLFAMGDGFKNTGIVLGAILMACLGVITVHAEHLLVI